MTNKHLQEIRKCTIPSDNKSNTSYKNDEDISIFYFSNTPYLINTPFDYSGKIENYLEGLEIIAEYNNKTIQEIENSVMFSDLVDKNQDIYIFYSRRTYSGGQ